MKIALVYDHINRVGGAERILLTLHELFPTAPLFTTVYDARLASWATHIHVTTSFLQKIPFAKTFHELFPGLPIFAFETFDFREFDVVISITAKEAKGIVTPPTTLHLCYCLTPTRYLWSHYHDYFRTHWFRTISLPLVVFLRIWDLVASSRPDVYFSISQTSAHRLRKYYRKDSQVIYPPVDTDFFTPLATQKVQGDYFLLVSRLVRYKRIEIAIEACNDIGMPLKIIGDGWEKKRLQKIAGSKIEFLGILTDQELRRYYQNCRALIFPQEEDFGITAVEAMACGRPVIAYRGGAAAELIREGITGEFFYPQTSSALKKIMEKLCRKTYNSDACRKQAEKFAIDRFKQEFMGILKKEVDRKLIKSI